MPETKLLLPKFLTQGMAKEVMLQVAQIVTNTHPLCSDLKRAMFHIVVLVPGVVLEAGKYPNNPVQPHLLAEHSQGDKKLWSHDYADIARCKALQLWHDRNDGGAAIKPHLLFPGETPFWGGVKRDGIVVACSGVQPWFDRMIAGMVADICIAYAMQRYEISKDKEEGVDFLT